MTTASRRAIAAVEQVLRHHRRVCSPTGAGHACTCGQHFDTAAEWDHHRAHLATAAAAHHLHPDDPGTP